MSKPTKRQKKERRQARVRATISGTSKRPRLSVSRSLNAMYIQLIDDTIGKTLVSVNSKKDKIDMVGKIGDRKSKVAVGYILGKTLAEKAKAINISKVVFDRGGYKYHGRVKAVADGARDGGLEF